MKENIPLLKFERTVRTEGWYEFKEKLTDVLKEMNPRQTWESSEYPWADGPPHIFLLKDANSVLKLLGRKPWDYTPDSLMVYKYRKSGLKFTYLDYDNRIANVIILPACKHGFHRDWKNDGICIANQEKSMAEIWRKL